MIPIDTSLWGMYIELTPLRTPQMSPLEFSASESFDPASSVSRGTEALAREVQNQVANAAANIGIDKIAALPAPGADAALGMAGGAPVPGADQALSPLMNIITKMPGHISFISSFFEALGSFFAPQLDMLSALDPSGLGNLFSADHFAIDLSLLPDDAPVLSTLDMSNGHMLNFGQSDVLSSKLNFSLGNSSNLTASKDLLFRNSQNVSGNLLGKPQYEGTGVLSGPSMGQGVQANHIAGNNRLFSDSISGGGMQNNMLAQAPATAQPTSLNVSGNGLTTNTSSTSAAGGLSDFKAFDGASQKVGYNMFGQGQSDNLIAYNNSDSFQSTISAPKAEVTGGAELGGLKAKAISIDGKQAMPDVKHSAGSLDKAAHGKDISASAKDATKEVASAKSHKVFDRANHSVKHTAHQPKAVAAKPAQPQAKAAQSAPEVKASEVNPQQQQQAQEVQNQNAQASQGADTKIADQSQASSGDNLQNGTHSYTIKAGDNLWNIAKDNLGQATKWTDIYKMNSDVLGANPELIRPGTTIQLPGAGQELNVANYTVKPGDNLFDIAKEQLGDSSKWGELYKANEGVIGSNPSLIHPGTELNLGGNAGSMQISQAPASVMPQGPDPVAQTAFAQPQIQQPMTSQNYGMEAAGQNMEQQAMQFEPTQAQPMAQPMLQNNGLKVVPAQAQPDMIIPPAHAADGSFANFETITMNSAKAPTINSKIGNDLMSFLNKRK
ncbi:MAG: LysM peptidoglycan-binding protein [Cyanobacteriota bacterium erpe_2018_sw_39hr_WHONDRS-SW48-000098_B_bin.30]|jgi:nucleoid-associated protein YgaU|nr:LysM peptidoglycan-binding protein [Cyanobacteriota bacterium erpe_2018_sw_39hr_WHONDRS-SW48-000098_B_bin.30]